MKRVEVRLPDELHKEFKIYSIHKHRSIHGQILDMIEKAVKWYKEELADIDKKKTAKTL